MNAAATASYSLPPPPPLLLLSSRATAPEARMKAKCDCTELVCPCVAISVRPPVPTGRLAGGGGGAPGTNASGSIGFQWIIARPGGGSPDIAMRAPTSEASTHSTPVVFFVSTWSRYDQDFVTKRSSEKLQSSVFSKKAFQSSCN